MLPGTGAKCRALLVPPLCGWDVVSPLSSRGSFEFASRRCRRRLRLRRRCVVLAALETTTAAALGLLGRPCLRWAQTRGLPLAPRLVSVPTDDESNDGGQPVGHRVIEGRKALVDLLFPPLLPPSSTPRLVKMVKGPAVITRDATIHLHKRVFGVSFKKKAPRAVAEIRKFVTQKMGTKDVRVDAELNNFIWSKGIRNVPYRVRVRMSRKIKDDDDAEAGEQSVRLGRVCFAGFGRTWGQAGVGCCHVGGYCQCAAGVGWQQSGRGRAVVWRLGDEVLYACWLLC